MRFCFFILISTAFLKSIVLEAFEEDQLVRRIQAHLTIGNDLVAAKEAKEALISYPNSLRMYEAYIRSLAKLGEEKQLLEAWDIYTQRFPDQSLNRELIEDMAWGILQKAYHSSSIIVREMALLAAFFIQEAKGVEILHRGMQDSNYAVRSVAVKLAGHFRDHRLIEEIKQLFHKEKVWAVRQQVLEAVGKMKIISLRPQLEGLIASNESLASEKVLAMAALLELLDSVSHLEIERLASSNRAGLRQLACQAIAHFQSLRDLDQLLRLVKDPHPDVRLEALQAIGKLRPVQKEDEIVFLTRQALHDSNYQVALSAAWLLTLYLPDEGQKAIQHFLNDERREVCLFASVVLAATGRYGIHLMIEQFRRHADPFVRLNLALGLIGQRQATEEAADVLTQMLMKEKGKWGEIEVGHFRGIIHRQAKKTEDSIKTPEIEDQLLRLELLNLLAVLKVSDAPQAIRQYLNDRSWEISAMAAVVLLTEGDESAIDIIREFTQDSQPRIRLQAALILSLWSREESAIQILEEGYVNHDWDFKAKILEGIGRIGSIRSIPFLIQVLKEPSQTLRLIAAMALIQCLNH